MPLGLELAAIDETFERMSQEARAEADAAVAVLETIERPGPLYSVSSPSPLKPITWRRGVRYSNGMR